ncbi:MAG: HEAT repeat domain-containing protein [Acidobacteriaceae bacterium]|nr:HEAT repeat domain-containing protein [Acidobacteriaceae bacterium]
MTPEEIRHLIPQFLSGELTPDELATFEAELNANADFRIEVEELRSIWEGLGLVPEEQPSAAMRARFYQRLNAVVRNGTDVAGERRSRWKFNVFQQVAAALILFSAGLLVGHLQPERQKPSGEVEQLQTQVQSLRQTVALSLLERQSATSRLQGVEWSNRVERPDGELLSALLNTLNSDPNVNVRLASLDALEKFADDNSVRKGLVESMSTQDSPLVQIALIDAMVRMRDRDVKNELRKLTHDSEVNAAVRQRAQWGLEKLSYQ